MNKKRFYFSAQATSVYGSQTYYVDAESVEEALEAVKQGDGVFVSEDLEVQDLGNFFLDSVEEIPNE